MDPDARDLEAVHETLIAPLLQRYERLAHIDANVLQAFGSPDVNPRRNQLARCCDEPCVNDSTFTRPVVCF